MGGSPGCVFMSSVSGGQYAVWHRWGIMTILMMMMRMMEIIDNIFCQHCGPDTLLNTAVLRVIEFSEQRYVAGSVPISC